MYCFHSFYKDYVAKCRKITRQHEREIMEAETIGFESSETPMLLEKLKPSDFDRLEFGLIAMTLEGIVVIYNSVESKYSGLSPERVLNRHFFTQVAPCTNNHLVAQRFNELQLDEIINYTFALRMKPVPVRLRMIRNTELKRMYLLVGWR